MSAPPLLEGVAAHLNLSTAPDGAIVLALDESLAAEAYRLEITATGVTLAGGSPQGVFWGVQTLLQFGTELPGGVIEDHPRYAYRGAMLDLARHFFTVAEIKAHVDLLVQFKINHLHLHLTDDQGWRLEIPGWPRLTEVSGGAGTGVDGAGPGFLTLAEYSDVVAYAAERFVTIVPEIDMPGHVNAVHVAYPELTADGQPVAPRTDAEVGYSSLVAGKEETYAFVETVLKTVAGLTPGPYLHIGGDECLSTPPEDYRTFLDRVLPIPGRFGKRVIGWHEIAAVDLPEDAVVQYWRIEPADDAVARAAASGRRVIISPADRTYLDMKYDSDTPLGLDWAGHLGVERAYDWDPAERLPGVGEEAILGVEAPLWSETLRSVDDVRYLTLPRLPAVAEVAWSPRDGRDWPSFRERLAAFGPRWTADGVNFHRSPEIDWH
ncbi:family 20 glycosylhydrolase [Actinoplanes sp. CA-252034]|uniref:family 20 glycosylhydrolase n=1 Tax=Actinoplanes sp. CA-252034 TaxID=3239906 RepID=UPI003D976B01